MYTADDCAHPHASGCDARKARILGWIVGWWDPGRAPACELTPELPGC
ncbi:Hypothetical protein A7982_08611 [Minicystis rosea]|nr:Hypothetical protein A7982_08611 [Minicystis rosea]